MEITKFKSLPPINDFIQIAEKLALTNYFIDEDGTLDKQVQTARGFAKIMYGHELGLSPMFAMQHVNIIKGKMTLDAGGVAALIAGSDKYDYKILEHTDQKCTLQFIKQNKLLGSVTWTIEDAKTAGIFKPNGAWTKYPKDMLFARAITAGARRHCPDIFGGSIYTPEELGEPETEATYTVETVQPKESALQIEEYTDKERKNFHALGSMIYGEEWDTKRHELVEYITEGRTKSSSDLTRSEMIELIQGMEDKQKQSIPSTGIES